MPNENKVDAVPLPSRPLNLLADIPAVGTAAVAGAGKDDFTLELPSPPELDDVAPNKVGLPPNKLLLVAHCIPGFPEVLDLIDPPNKPPSVAFDVDGVGAPAPDENRLDPVPLPSRALDIPANNPAVGGLAGVGELVPKIEEHFSTVGFSPPPNMLLEAVDGLLSAATSGLGVVALAVVA